MPVRALRGATTVDSDSAGEVKKRAAELMTGLLERNNLGADAVISVFFTATPDISSVAPAAGIREIGITEVPLLCATEMVVDGSLEMCIRLMLHVETDKARSEMRHLFMRGATVLRPDLVEPDPGATHDGGQESMS